MADQGGNLLTREGLVIAEANGIEKVKRLGGDRVTLRISAGTSHRRAEENKRFALRSFTVQKCSAQSIAQFSG